MKKVRLPDTFTEKNFTPYTECDRIGLSGGCGKTCPVYLEGECESEDEIRGQDDEDLATEIAQSLFRKWEREHEED